MFSITDTICGKYEKKLLRHLMVDYDDMERPVENETEPLMLTFGVTLQQIIDVVITVKLIFTHQSKTIFYSKKLAHSSFLSKENRNIS